jgi:nucleotide-binding universal stress UspA family protein
MTLDSLGPVFCAVRGGPESRKTITHAIDLALQLGASLNFFRIMDAEFLDHATVGPLSVVYRELEEIARFAMLILCDRARRRGLTEVDYIIREGNIRKQLQQLATEVQSGILVMGRPTRGPGRNVFRPAEFDVFVSDLEGRGEMQVIAVTPSPETEEGTLFAGV